MPPALCTRTEARHFIRDALAKVGVHHRALLLAPRLTNETTQAVKQVAGQFNRVAMRVARDEAALCETAKDSSATLDAIRDADAIIVLGATPSRHNPVVAAQIRAATRRRGAKLIVLNCRKSDLDYYADIAAAEVSLERAFWSRIASKLEGAKRPVLVYGPRAMTPIGVTAMDRLIGIFETHPGSQSLQLLPLSIGPNSLAMTAAGIEPIEAVGPWLDASPLGYLHMVASDDPGGWAGMLDEKHVPRLLQEIECVVVQAAYLSPLSNFAHVVLPVTAWSEMSGHTTNIEGRILPLQAVTPPRDEAKTDQQILEAVLK